MIVFAKSEDSFRTLAAEKSYPIYTYIFLFEQFIQTDCLVLRFPIKITLLNCTF